MTQILPSHCWTDFESHTEYSQVTVNKLLISNHSSEELPEFAKRLANLELRENDKRREQSLEAFRNWINKNPNVKNIRTDSNFLLRFLRAKKFSLPMAQEMLLKYLNLKQTFRHFFCNLDFISPPVNQLINNGYLFASPQRDKLGRRIIFGFAENLDIQKYSNADFAKVHVLTYEAMLCDQITQITGVVHFGNCAGLSPAVLTYFTPKEFYTVVKWGEQSLPLRHKELHFINVPSALRYIYEFFQSIFSEKIRSRFMIHNSLSSFQRSIDVSVLPKEYGGVIPMAEMIEMWKQELMQKREQILALDNMILLDNRCVTKRKYNTLNNDTCNVMGSFHKLEID